MLYIKSYCYSKHELPFIIANLDEGFNHIDKLILYEYNYTHSGVEKKYEIDDVLHLIPDKLKTKLLYIKKDLKNYMVKAVNDEKSCHNINENIQRSMFFNDSNIVLNDDDIIIDIDIDEIIYNDCYDKLLSEIKNSTTPLSIKMNQFFFKNNYLWSNLIWNSPSIYTYKMVKNINKNIKGINCKWQRDCPYKTKSIYGCHMSWVMPISAMIKKIYSGAHTTFHHLANEEILKKAINEKQYIFDTRRKFDIIELDINDKRIPNTLQNKNLFDFL
tara:strand:+ start:7711 stop:8529 length:819 start_codon:yes stop_codon:yes gene_type:complete